eukprot:GFUD01034499.1.p1 GENE.GFUD01034499.1~~GFUD01034499.1.p1  ORF type:complete len:167 (+),score=26.65 GFUD01034499.1:140-640(+)
MNVKKPTKMISYQNEMFSVRILICSLLIVSAYGQAIVGQENGKGDCKGLLKLISTAGDVEEYTEDQRDLNVKPAKAILEGCACYRLFERKNKRGRSYYVNKIGEHSIPLKKVGSLAIVPCSREAMPMWSVALIVVGLVIVVGVIVVLIFKRKRRSHESVPTIDQTI